MYLFPDNVKENVQKANIASTTARRWKFYYSFLNNGPDETKKQQQQDDFKFLWLKILGFLEQSSKRKIIVLNLQPGGAWYPGRPQLYPPAHPGASSRLPTPLQTEATCSFVALALVCGHLGVQVENCVWNCERDNLGASPCSGVIPLVVWDTFALRMHLTQWAVSLIPLFSFLRTTQTLFDAIITVKAPFSTASSLIAKVQFGQIWNNHLSQRTNPQARDQHLFYSSMQRMLLSLTNYLNKNKIKIIGTIQPCLLSHSNVL